MIKLFIFFIQITIFVLIASIVIHYSFPVSFQINDIILSTSTTFLIFSVIFIVFIALFIQRIVFFFDKDFLNSDSIDNKTIMKKDILPLHKA